MTGYVRPLRGELKVRQYEHFKAVYCGLCHSLGRRYGPFARYALSYDLTFLALALSAVDCAISFEEKRCPASPIVKKCVQANCSALEKAADISVILTWWKLYDHVLDGKMAEKALYKTLCVLLKPYYRKAARYMPDYERTVRESLSELYAIEKERSGSLDRAADAFARCLSAASGLVSVETAKRPFEQIFYHVGRWVYIMDAFDDIQDDIKHGTYNPIVLRFGIKDSVPEEVRRQIDLTARHSVNLAIDAYELAEFGTSGDIISNILYLGLPFVQKRVLEGTWQKGEKHERSL